MVAASIHSDAELNILNVGINETRAGIISVLKRMGANLEFNNKVQYSGEPACDIAVKSSKLKGTRYRKKAWYCRNIRLGSCNIRLGS